MAIIGFLVSWILVGLVIGWSVGSAAKLGSREDR